MRRAALVFSVLLLASMVPASAQTDLDAFMRDVVARRDDNWKKLQQYILDERQVIELRGPSHVPLWGERRDYTWYLRDGFFVRSPVKVNGVDVPESERVQYERDYLARVKQRDARPNGDPGNAGNGGNVDGAEGLENLIRQSRQPEFVSSAYFLRFKFDEGKYALVGHETVDGRDLLKVEYYPAKLFGGTDRRRTDTRSDDDRAYDAEFQRLMNKASLVTLWIEPATKQIVKYTFDNIALDFLPAQLLVHVDTLKATMSMGQPFPDVWLPRDLDFAAAATLAVGQFDLHYRVDYTNYKRADVATKVTIK
jgi:hypothetical protein